MRFSYILIPFFFFLLLLIVFFSVFLFLEAKIDSAADINNKDNVVVEIQKGMGVDEISLLLEENKLVGNNFYFKYAVWREGKADFLQAGLYEISRDSSPRGLVKIFVSGQAMDTSSLVIIPEGFTLRQIEARLVSEELIDYGEMADFVNNYIGKDFPDIPDNTGLEGFFFPDSYRFGADITAQEIISKVLKNFSNKLSLDMRQDIEKQGKTIYNILKVASMVEGEVRKEQDMRLVSGIIWKRLNIGMPLQIDATIIYAKEKMANRPLSKSERLVTYFDLSIVSPYNTYLTKGLPPTPISNPGLQAIKAAIYPLDSDFLYYLSKPDGETVFSRTLEEHNWARAMFF